MTMQPIPAMPIDAELWWIVYLRGALSGRSESFLTNVKFDRKVPNPRPNRFVVLTRDGGGVSGVFDQARVRLDVWSDSEKNATDLANFLAALVQVAPLADAGCVRATVNAPSPVADESGQPRRLALIEATHRAVVLTTP